MSASLASRGGGYGSATQVIYPSATFQRPPRTTTRTEDGNNPASTNEDISTARAESRNHPINTSERTSTAHTKNRDNHIDVGERPTSATPQVAYSGNPGNPIDVGGVGTVTELPSFYQSVYPWPTSYRDANARLTRSLAVDSNQTTSFKFFFLALVYLLVCQLYLMYFLMLPSLYFRRVDQVLQDADLSIEEITDLTIRSSPSRSSRGGRDTGPPGGGYSGGGPPGGGYSGGGPPGGDPPGGDPPGGGPPGSDPPGGDPPGPLPDDVAQRFRKLRKEWTILINDFVGEWKTLNVVSAVLVPGILTLFQVDSAANDPATRSLTFWSLLLALWSLVYGAYYIIQFSQMRNTCTIVEWALEAQKENAPFWNTWVMLALPAVSLAWSVLVFITTIVWFMWRSRANLPSNFPFRATPSTEFGFHVLICAILGIAAIYFVLALIRFHQYGTLMTGVWIRRVRKLVAEVRLQGNTRRHESEMVDDGKE